MASDRVFFALGSFLAGTAVAAGAFGAHALRGRIAPEMLDAFSTGARYQMFHALALLALAWGQWVPAVVVYGGGLAGGA